MIESIIPWVFGALLLAVIIGVGWWQIKEHGEEREQRRQAEADRDAAMAEVEASRRAPANRDEASSVLRRRLARLERRLRRARQGRE